MIRGNKEWKEGEARERKKRKKEEGWGRKRVRRREREEGTMEGRRGFEEGKLFQWKLI